MPKAATGRAGRERKREERLEQYVGALAPMLFKQLKYTPESRILLLGSPGVAQLAETLAHTLTTGEILVVVYTYDEMEETRAALAGLGNVEVINEIKDLDPDEPPFDIAASIVPYYQGREHVDDLLAAGLQLLAPGGTLIIGGDRQQGFERTVEALGSIGSRVTPLVQSGQYRVVAATKAKTGRLRLRTPGE